LLLSSKILETSINLTQETLILICYLLFNYYQVPYNYLILFPKLSTNQVVSAMVQVRYDKSSSTPLGGREST
jgi:hypothetical protein